MNYYREYWDTRRKFRYVSDLEDFKGYERWHFKKGERIETWDDNSWIKTTDPDCDGTPEDVLQNHLGLPIFSERMRRILNENNVTGIQYLPIQVFRINEEKMPGYCIANILNLVPAFDYEKSGYNLIPDDHINVKQRGKIGGIHRLVVHSGKLGEFDIFRLKEFTLEVLLSEKFVKIFKKNKLTGWVFSEVTQSE